MVGDALLAAPVLRAGERGREVYLPRGRWYDFWTGAPVRTGDFFRADAPLDHLPLYVRGGSIVPSTEAMNYTGEKPWNPLRFDVYPDDNGAASGSLYEDDGLTPAYKTGAFRRTAFALARDAGGSQLTLGAPAGTHQPGARRFEFIVHNLAAFDSVSLDDQPLASVGGTAAAAGWWRDDTGALYVRLPDDSHAHTLRLR